MFLKAFSGHFTKGFFDSCVHREIFPQKRWIVLNGFLKDKDHSAIVRLLKPAIEIAIVTEPPSERARKGLEVFRSWEKEKIPALAREDKPAALQLVNRLHAAGVLTIPAGAQIVRLLPPLNLKPQEAGEGLSKIEEVVKSLA